MNGPPTSDLRPPFFTVVVPVYNHQQYIGEALDSLLAQIDDDWEAVVVDDGSTDDTPRIVDEYAATDQRFRIVHKENGGQASALNAGVENARGEWICWLSSDDLFEPDKLAVHREWFEKRPDCQFFFTDFKTLIDETGEIKEDVSFGTIPDNREWYVITLLEYVYINGISICVNRRVFDEIGLFNEEYRYAQDYDLYMRAFVHFPPVHMPVRTCVMRSHSAQYTVTHESPMFFQCAQAAIDFVNQHAFVEMFPLIDLSRPLCAANAVDRALDVAIGKHCFLYGLGVHPGLFARIIDWVEGLPKRREWRPIRNAVAARLRAASLIYRGTDIGDVCRASAIRYDQKGNGGAHHDILPWEVAQRLYSRLLRETKDKAECLRKFVAQHFRVELPEKCSLSVRTVDIVLVVESCTDVYDSGVSLLITAGNGITLTEMGARCLTLRKGAIVVGCVHKLRSVLSWASLPPPDIVVDVLPASLGGWPLAVNAAIGVDDPTMLGRQTIDAPSPVGRLASVIRKGLGTAARIQRIVNRTFG